MGAVASGDAVLEPAHRSDHGRGAAVSHHHRGAGRARFVATTVAVLAAALFAPAAVEMLTDVVDTRWVPADPREVRRFRLYAVADAVLAVALLAAAVALVARRYAAQRGGRGVTARESSAAASRWTDLRRGYGWSRSRA
jgi:hypothetical protein